MERCACTAALQGVSRLAAPFATPAAPHAAGLPSQRVVVFPHAGAGPRPYEALADRLPGTEVVGVCLPGRERLCNASTLTYGDYRTLPDRLADELAALPPMPTVFYGHSMGGVLAALTAAADPDACVALVTSASPPGARALPIAPLSTEDGWRDFLARHDFSVEAIERLEQLPMQRRVLAADLLLARHLLLAADSLRLGVAVLALAAESDHLVPPAAVSGWAALTTGPSRVRRVPGGHWFPFLPGGRAAVRDEIVAVLPRPPGLAASAARR